MDHTLEAKPSLLMTCIVTGVGMNRVAYDPNTGLIRMALLITTIDDKPPFHRTPARLQLNAPAASWSSGGSTPPDICGAVTIMAGLKDPDLDMPIYARIGMTHESFAAVLASIDRALAIPKEVKFHLDLDPPGGASIEINQLDISQTSTHAIRNFHLMA